MGKYLCMDGEYFSADEPRVYITNRALNYGDGIFETIRCKSSEPLFFENHFERIKRSLATLKIQLPAVYTEKYFRHHINKLLQRNRIYKGARIRITLYRNSGGLYTPNDNGCGFFMVSEALSTEQFTLNEKGLRVGVYTDERKSITLFSGLKSCNALLFVMAGLWKKEQDLNDCLLLNQNGKIIEGLSSNIFLVKDGVVKTPALSSGCIAGTMRKNILKLIGQMNLPLLEVDGFVEKDLLEADEVFLTNAIQGITQVTGYSHRRYYHKLAAMLVEELNLLIS